jgi:hypothetical protein
MSSVDSELLWLRAKLLAECQFIGMRLRGPDGRPLKRQPSPGPGFPANAGLNNAARAPFSKESRMKLANATKLQRKSGGGPGHEHDLSAVPGLPASGTAETSACGFL